MSHEDAGLTGLGSEGPVEMSVGYGVPVIRRTGTSRAAASAMHVSWDAAAPASIRCSVRVLSPATVARCSCDHARCSLRVRIRSAFSFMSIIVAGPMPV